MNRVGEVASAAGRGLFAGTVGTAAMTASSTLEMKLRDREGSTAPADAASKVLGVEPSDPEGKARFSNAVHWAYGIGWGAVRGLIGAAGLTGPKAAGAHFGAIWTGALVMLPSLGVAAPPWRWGATELGIDAMHHLVYVTATSVTYATISD